MKTKPSAPRSDDRSSGRRTDYSFASRDLGQHLARGMVGFGGLLLAVWAYPAVGLAALVPAAVGVLALRGCPMCWTIGLIQTISRGRFRRSCDDDGCALVHGPVRAEPVGERTRR